MAENFHPNYCWNNSATSSGGFDRSIHPLASPPPSSSLSRNPATTTDAGAASFSWPSTAEISEFKPSFICHNQIDSSHTRNFNWNQTLQGKAECSLHSMIHDHDRGTRPFSRLELGESSSTIPFKEGNCSSSSSSSSPSSSSSSSYMYSSTMLQGLVEPGSSRSFQQRPGLDGQKTAHEYCQSQMMAFRGVSNDQTKQSPLWKQFGDAYNPLWINGSAGFYPSPPSPSRTQLSESKPGCRKTGMGLGGDWVERGSRSAVPEQKKARIEAPLAMPAIAVIGKEKLRDRVTALQQLVSPFGKTDTASVLQEAIEYIKFLHDQVNVLYAPYFKTGGPMPQIQNSDYKCVKARDEEERRPDVLRSRGLCLIPLERIYPADNESVTTPSEFWTPIHGRTYW